MFSWVYPVLGVIFPLRLAVLCLSSFLRVCGGSTSKPMYRKDKPRNVPRHTEISFPSCACAPACPSSADPLDSRSIMLSGCWDNAVRKLEVSRPLYVYVVRSKLKHLNIAYCKGISMDYGQNHEPKPFSDPL